MTSSYRCTRINNSFIPRVIFITRLSYLFNLNFIQQNHILFRFVKKCRFILCVMYVQTLLTNLTCNNFSIFFHLYVQFVSQTPPKKRLVWFPNYILSFYWKQWGQKVLFGSVRIYDRWPDAAYHWATLLT